MSSTDTLREALDRCIHHRLTFAAFRLPGMPVQLWAQRTPELETVEGSLLLELNQVFLLAPFALQEDRVPFIRADIELMFAEIAPDIDRLSECMGTPSLDTLPLEPTTRVHFEDNVRKAISTFGTTPLEKVVLSRTINVPIDPRMVTDLYLQALEDDATTCVVVAYTPVHGLWLGTSPERLVQEEEDHVRVDSLAGTLPLGEAPERVGEWGAKELDEQDLVTRHVLHTFVRLGLKDVVSRGPDVRVAGPVAHLHTAMEAELGECLLGDLVLALHPTPAVCGTPVPDAKAFIKSNEGHDRELYSGFWGPWNADGPTELFVNIRCMRVYEQQARLFVGAGITAGSDAGKEWLETEHKASTWLRLLEAQRV